MSDTSQLETALINADKAGDADAARALAAEITKRRIVPVVAEKQMNPTEGISNTENFLAGAGKAMHDIGQGVGTAITDVFPKAAKYGMSTRKDVDESKLRDAALMNTGAGISGNVVGNLASLLPTALVPGANTILGGAAIGGLTGALQPVGTEESRGLNSLTGTAAGAVVPAAIRGFKIGKAALIDPFTAPGNTRIAANVLNRAAANPSAVAERLKNVQGSTPGFNPTVGQAADDAGIGALERTMRAINPREFDLVDKSQRGALVDALKNIAGTPEARSIQQQTVNDTARKLYGSALKENVEVTPELLKLASRPSMQLAESRARNLSSELSTPFQAALSDLRPKDIPMSAPITQSSSVTTPYNQYTNIAPGMTNESEIIPRTGYFQVPPVESVPVRDLHTLKMGMDALLSDPTLGIAGREANAIKATRGRLLDLLPESYQTARQAHIDLNKPIHQMDIGQELYNRFTPALADQGGLPFKSTAGSYANALRNGDELAKNVTGMKNATLEGIMTPEQMASLHGVAKDAALKAAAENIGRGAGSDTVQKLSMSNIAQEAGLPKWLAAGGKIPSWAIGAVNLPAGLIKHAGDVIYGSADKEITARLADLLRNPQEAARVMLASGAPKSEVAKFLMKAPQAASISGIPVANSQQ